MNDVTSASRAQHDLMANALRALAMDAVEQAASGHPGMPMGMADVATVLFRDFLRFSPSRPDWPDRDRFVLSAGHGSMLLYSLLHLTGYERMPLEELKRFRQLGSRTAGHPEYELEAGIETTTGPLGQGFGNSVGMAIAEAHLNARFGDDLVHHRTFVIASDGDLMEGISHEAAALAGHLGLGRLIVLYDDNGISIDGPTSLAYSDDVTQRFEAYHWHVQAIDGHDPDAVHAAIAAALHEPGRPSLIACRTTIGYGANKKAGTAAAHGAPLGEEEITHARERLGWSHPPFEVPEEVRQLWRDAGARGEGQLAAWDRRHAAADPETRAAFEAAMAGEVPASVDDALAALTRKLADEAPKEATRKSSGRVLEALYEALPSLIGGSADLTPSNNTRPPQAGDMAPGNHAARYIRFGVREHGMMAALSGMALHGGVIPYGGTFLIFSDYARPSIRLAAMMGQRVILVATHDSIGLGEDGPTHQPVEHLAALRAIPNLHVYRPGDPIEVAECWQLALHRREGPSLLALSRQGMETLRPPETVEGNRCREGAYILREAAVGAARVSLLATGAEVELAVKARDALEGEGIGTRVVSMPCWERFGALEGSRQTAILGEKTLRVGIEAAGSLGWERWLGAEGLFIGLHGFGVSAPYKDAFKHFGFTAEAVTRQVRERLTAPSGHFT